MQDYILNIWYMAAWAEEVTSDLFSRKLLGKAVLLVRDKDGEPVALRDRCPHRFAPLSMGRREGDHIVCGYHGLTFDTRGNCVRNPYSDRIPAGASVNHYPTVERDDIIWIWFGDPALADPATVPDFSQTKARPDGSCVHGYTSLNANYEYVTDNLLDLSHIEFLHTGTFAGNGVIFKGKHEVKQAEGNQLYSNWWMPGVRVPPGFDKAIKGEKGDHWLDMRWDAPASMYLQVGATGEGQPREAGMALHQCHILTPADAHETHYFWSSRNPYPMTPEAESRHREMIRDAFEIEDTPMIEAAYRNLADADFWSQKPVSIGVDGGGARARRVIESLKRAERGDLAREKSRPEFEAAP